MSLVLRCMGTNSNEIHTDGRGTRLVYKICRLSILSFIIKKTMLILLCCLSAILTRRKKKHNHIRNFSEGTLSQKTKLAAELK